ncbi:M17 family peptidase N-terminal domain-containing protein [Ferruginibacter paludis]|uniref:M17 family peptidase N-terminal domain-containing protein n=1 Tax=Ferruginibacter paludis TaxID=1310417 RepID=UPI0025B60EE5|nr:M17 family peptidase N-terminal domain-containing protein [Ferruginibacter paludis]MDN3656066.1 M17 family peptidase N-terminal domain-containing protein [Ferruginibacter paludis]
MENNNLFSSNRIKIKKMYLVALLFLSPDIFAQAGLPKLGTSKIIGKVDGISIEAKVQSPSGQQTPLQVVCLFEYTEGDIFNPPALPKELNGMLHVDEALHGLITELRKSGKFSGYRYETLLIDPPANTIPAKKLLLVGLGDRNIFDPAIMETVGRIGMREALRMGVTSYSHASDLKDAGIASPTASVAGLVVKGALEAYRTQTHLKNNMAAKFLPITKFTLLTGPAFFEDSQKGVLPIIQTFKN